MHSILAITIYKLPTRNGEEPIFLSYAKEDYSIAFKIFVELKERNLNIWFEQASLLPWQNWRNEIKKAIESSKFFLLLISSNSVSKNGFIQKEIKNALDIFDEFPDEQIFIIPVKIEPCEITNIKLRELQCIDLHLDWNYGFEKILKVIAYYNEKNDNVNNIKQSILNLIFDSNNAANIKKSFNYLQKAKSICEQNYNKKDVNRYIYLINVLAEMAIYSRAPNDRRKYWIDCISMGSKALNNFENIKLIDAFSNKVVDYIQDHFVFTDFSQANNLLSLVIKNIDNIYNNLSEKDQALLLSRKSSLYRNMSRYQVTNQARVRISEKALRCSEKSVNLDPSSWYSYLDYAQSLWNHAQFIKNDKKYYSILTKIEDNFWHSIVLQPNPYNTLALARFFRLTYQTTPFLEIFDLYFKNENNKRRYLQSSFLFGEGVINLYYQNYPHSVVFDRLSEAERILQECIDSGYEDARHIVDLAFIKAAKGEVDIGLKIINKLHSLPEKTTWSELINIIQNINSQDDLFAQGFALGINDSFIWNKLGTFAKDFLNDYDLAILLYEESLNMNKSNIVTLTNIAQTYLLKEDSESIEKAKYYISTASSCATDRRFRWWRNVREKIDSKVSHMSEISDSEMKKSPRIQLNKLSDLHQSFQKLKIFTDPQKRGYEFERIFERLLNLTLKNSFSSYRTSLKIDKISCHQIDAAFCFYEANYRTELKWTSNAVPPKEIVLFRDKLDVVGIKGLFLSINGFTNEAINKAYELRKEAQILLMDGEEFENILQGCPMFDEAIRIKQIYFAKESNPYFKITSLFQIAS